MKIGFTTNPSPGLNLSAIAANAKLMGYDGVEISSSASDMKQIRPALDDAGIEVCCLTSPVIYQRSSQQNIRGADDLRRGLATAFEIGARVLKVFGPQDRATTAQEFGNWLLPLGDQASEAHVGIAIENTFSLRSAKEMWSMLDQMNHPAIGCCWTLPTAVNAESPGISVPVLNFKIFYAKVATPRQTEPDDQSRIEKFIKRLNGIGYGGYVTIDSAPSDSASSIDETLIIAVRKWRSPARLF